MKKFTIALIALIAGTLPSIAGGTEPSKPSKFEFVNLNTTQNSWDYSYMHYTVKDEATGDIIEVPSFLIKYEVKDKAGKTVASGKGAYVNTADTKLGSEENYTIRLSTMINGQEVSQNVEKTASPKKVSVQIDADHGDAVAVNYTFTRPKFNTPDVQEKIEVDPTAVTVDVAVASCSGCNTDNHIRINDPADIKNLSKTIKSMTKGNKEVIIEPSIAYKGEVYKDNSNMYAATASGIHAVDPLAPATADQ
ncbi:MAG: hypothetical protein JST90_16715 [Bacteroidetes bacterium]|nr:hypothetical protein [Bacteroidota bacterium]